MMIANTAVVVAIHLCAAFNLFPVHTQLGPKFALSSFNFQDLGTPVSRVSDNAGEKWQLVNAHLPPIYAVRLY